MACIFLLFRSRLLEPGGRRPTALPGRVLNTIPTFKYSPALNAGSSQGKPNNGDPSDQSVREEGDDERGCSICLADFVEGDELRMLGCLHVFHRSCVDQWLAVSRECPLCKRDVVASAAAADPTDIAGAAFAAQQGNSYNNATTARRRSSRPWRCLGGQRAVRTQQQLGTDSRAAAGNLPSQQSTHENNRQSQEAVLAPRANMQPLLPPTIQVNAVQEQGLHPTSAVEMWQSAAISTNASHPAAAYSASARIFSHSVGQSEVLEYGAGVGQRDGLWEAASAQGSTFVTETPNVAVPVRGIDRSAAADQSAYLVASLAFPKREEEEIEVAL